MDIYKYSGKKVQWKPDINNPLTENGNNSLSKIYSEWGQDFIMLSIFNRLNMNYKDITYIDLGAFKPDVSNNTFSFYIRGSRGILVEANPTLIYDLYAKRPNDIILNNCITPFKSNHGSIDFYILNPPELSSISKTS